MDERENVVIVAGAGSTYSDGLRRPVALRPPLNLGFFRECREDEEAAELLAAVRDAFIALHGADLLDEAHDNLEGALVKAHSDLLSLAPRAAGRAAREELFRNLALLLNSRMANATNGLEPDRDSNIRRILSFYLREKSFAPRDVCVVTFNYDLHIERNLRGMAADSMFAPHQGGIFNFPHLYGLGEQPAVAAPAGELVAVGGIPHLAEAPVFVADAAPRADRIALLKLHGSLNWYSAHASAKPSYGALMNPERKLHITTRMRVDPYMAVAGKKRRLATCPVVVPPIVGKAAVFHRLVKRIWATARERLGAATEVVVFGYSFPTGDYESVNMLENAVGQNRRCRHVHVINPDCSVATRMGMIPKRKPITLFPGVESFLSSRAADAAAPSARGGAAGARRR